ncbi:MAG: hypothetical protein KDD60_07490, partial [Bdellovibrionales bacterium]|nr:hypothetical protein [Bdellovibrionales bacterium]
ERAAYEYQVSLEKQERGVVGVNCYTENKEAAVPVLRIDETIEREQCARIAEYRKKRDSKRIEESLKALTRSAQSGTNLMPHLITAAKADATLGEMSDILRTEFGEY